MTNEQLTLDKYEFVWAGADGRRNLAEEMQAAASRDGFSLQFMEGASPDPVQLKGKWFPVMCGKDALILWARKRRS